MNKDSDQQETTFVYHPARKTWIITAGKEIGRGKILDQDKDLDELVRRNKSAVYRGPFK